MGMFLLGAVTAYAPAILFLAYEMKRAPLVHAHRGIGEPPTGARD